MKFIDETIIDVEAGNGGNGAVSFRREKYVPRGGPAGGDGGDGGSVILIADEHLSTLLDVSYRRSFKAGHGAKGGGKQMTGRSGEDRVIRVPVGTVVYDVANGECIADLDFKGVPFVVAKGGRGGRGNMHFATATNQAPRKAEPGGEGEKKKVRLELKLMADVGLVGLPNAGKSTFISAVSNARPKIADYPFTTKIPNLGMVKLGVDRSFVMADIPGLIEGAHEGAGMGIKFLRHIERTKIFLHLVDIGDASHPDPVRSYRDIRSELGSYSEELLSRPEVVVLTKMDLTEVKDLAQDVAAEIGRLSHGKVLCASAATGHGVQDVLREIEKIIFG
jgi:GTP-binding protein